MKKQEYITPHIDTYMMNITRVMDTNSIQIQGQPTGKGNHNIPGAKASFGFDNEEPDDAE